jgi:hypothetical protein
MKTSDRPGRWVCATGLVFVALVLVGGPVLIGGSTPDASASGRAVTAFYAAHHSRQRIGAVLLTLAFVAFLFFAGMLRARWRRDDRAEAWAAVALAAAAVLVAGQTANARVTRALTDAPRRPPRR